MKHLYLILFCLVCSFYASAQCPVGQTEISIEIFHPSFGNEVGWELVDQTTGTVIACQPTGTYTTSPTPTLEGPYCVTDGNTLVFTGYDSFGDDWNGGYFNVIVTEDGSVNECCGQNGTVVLQNAGEDVDVEPDVDVASSCDTPEAEEFVITLPSISCVATSPNPIEGCTTMGDPNFSPCATVDDGSCVCSDTQTGLADGDTFCTDDAATTVMAILPDSPVTAVLTDQGSFDNELGIGLYAGMWDDGSTIGLPPAGTGLFGTATEPSLEGSTPGANNVSGNSDFGNPAATGNSVTSPPLTNGATYTLFIMDSFGDGWNGNDADLVDCEGNVILANLAQYIDAIGGNAQDEVAWVTFTYNAPPAMVTWSGTGAVTTDPDGTPNSGDEVYTFDPAMVTVTGCDPMDIDLTMTVTLCGETCETVATVSVFPPAQAPTLVRNDDDCTYTLTPACPNDVLAPATIADAAPGDDPTPVDVIVDVGGSGCTTTFSVDPEACPDNAVPPTIDITDPCNCNAGLDLDGDGVNEFAQETITITPGTPPYNVTAFTGNIYDNTGTLITTNAALDALIAGNTLIVYVDADGTSTYSVTIADGAGLDATVTGGPCDPCSDPNACPTPGGSADAGSLGN